MKNAGLSHLRILPVFTLTLLLCGPAVTAQEQGSTKVYKTIGDIELSTKIYFPADWKKGDKNPAVVFFFGGGWRSGDPKQFRQQCLHFAKRGMVAFAPEYRIKNKHKSTPIDSTEDAKSMIRWMRANAEMLGIDPEKIAAGGGSAGGHLAAATATVGEAVNGKDDDLSISAKPNALLLFNPAVNLANPRVKERFGEEAYKRIQQISPHQNLEADLPPTIIFHGEDDSVVSYAQQEAFVEKAKKLGIDDVTLVGYPGKGHGFFNYGRGDGKDYEDTVKRADALLTRLGWIAEK